MTEDMTQDFDKIRRDLIAELQKENPDWREAYKPGTFGCHEAMHAAAIYAKNLVEDLLHHPAILANQDWHGQALKSVQSLLTLAETIAEKHLTEEDDA